MKTTRKFWTAAVVITFALAGANFAYGGPRAMAQAFEYGHLPGSLPGEPTVWSVEQVVGSGEWLFDTKGDDSEATGCRSGSKNARIISNGSGDTTKLISPVVDLSGYANAQLHFWFINRSWAGDNDWLTIYYRTSPSAAWISLQVIKSAHEEWTRCDIELPNLSSTYQVAFEHYDKYGHGIGIDDVEIGPALNTWTDGNGVKWTYYVDQEDGRAKIYNGDEYPAIDNPTTRTSVTVPAKLNGIDADIGEYAFYGCSALTSITIEDGVTSIGNYAFSGCTALASATIPASVMSVDTWVFRHSDTNPSKNTPFWNNQPDGLVVLGSVAYRVKGTCPAVVNIPDNVKVLGPQAFKDCDTLEEVTIPSSVQIWKASVFYGCTALTSVTIEDGVTEIGATAFSGCNALTSVTIPGSVKSIGNNAFSGLNALTSVTFGHGVTSIGAVAFYNCDALSEVTIPSTVTSIGTDSFAFCKSLARIYVEAGDTAHVKGLVEGSGFTGDVTYIEIEPTIWYTTRAEALAEAKKTGKTVFMICGRDTCWNTMTTKNVSCEDPMVKDKLTAKCVLWYTNCDTQQDENIRYWPEGPFTLPVICAIDPKDPEHFLFQVTGYQPAGNILSLLSLLPDPSDPSGPSVIDPESLDPFYPGVLPCYDVLNPADIWDPIRAPKAVTLMGAAYYGCDVVGIVELKVGKLNNQKANVSGSVTLLDGKKYTIKSKKSYFGDELASTLYLDVKGLGDMWIAIGSMGGINVFSGSLGKWHVQTAKVGTGLSQGTVTASVAMDDLSMFSGKIVSALLPTNEVASASGGKWTFAKAASVKWAKLKDGVVPLVQAAGSDKGLIVDESKGKTNRSGLKLTYTAKKGTFKGSFKVYALEGEGAKTKLKKYTVNVNGVVVDGVGYGTATCKKPTASWPVTVK